MWKNSSKFLQTKWKKEEELKKIKEEEKKKEEENLRRYEELKDIVEKKEFDDLLSNKFLIKFKDKIKTKDDVIKDIIIALDILIPELMKIILEYCVIFDSNTEVGYSICTINYGIRDYYENFVENGITLFLKAKVTYMKKDSPICILFSEFSKIVNVGRVDYNYYFKNKDIIPKLGDWCKHNIRIPDNYRIKYKK